MPSTEPTADARSEGGTPTRDRELRAQGRRTLRRLLDGGRDVFAERGFHAARVDDIVRRAQTSHGTFYLYFANKEDLLDALVRDCEEEVRAIASRVPELTGDDAGYARLRGWIGEFDEMYGVYHPVIRSWIEAQPSDQEFDKRAAELVGHLRDTIEARLREGGGPDRLDPTVAALALVGMVERFSSYSRRLPDQGDRGAALDSVARMAHRGLFGATATATAPSRA